MDTDLDTYFARSDAYRFACSQPFSYHVCEQYICSFIISQIFLKETFVVKLQGFHLQPLSRFYPDFLFYWIHFAILNFASLIDRSGLPQVCNSLLFLVTIFEVVNNRRRMPLAANRLCFHLHNTFSFKRVLLTAACYEVGEIVLCQSETEPLSFHSFMYRFSG